MGGTKLAGAGWLNWHASDMLRDFNDRQMDICNYRVTFMTEWHRWSAYVVVQINLDFQALSVDGFS